MLAVVSTLCVEHQKSVSDNVHTNSLHVVGVRPLRQSFLPAEKLVASRKLCSVLVATQKQKKKNNYESTKNLINLF